VHVVGIQGDGLRKVLLGIESVAAIAVDLCHVGPTFFKLRVQRNGLRVRFDRLFGLPSSVFTKTIVIPRYGTGGILLDCIFEVNKSCFVVMHLVIHNTALMMALVVVQQPHSLSEVLQRLQVLTHSGATLPSTLPRITACRINAYGLAEVFNGLRKLLTEGKRCSATEIGGDKLGVHLQHLVEDRDTFFQMAGVNLEKAERDGLIRRELMNALRNEFLCSAHCVCKLRIGFVIAAAPRSDAQSVRGTLVVVVRITTALDAGRRSNRAARSSSRLWRPYLNKVLQKVIQESGAPY
jgi:hypothetical protein